MQHQSPPAYDKAMRRYSAISLIPAPRVFSGTDPVDGDEDAYELLTFADTGAASYADMIRDHETFTVDPDPDDIELFPDTSLSRVTDKALYQIAVDDGFVIHEITHRRLTYAGEGRRSILVGAAGSDGPLTFDEARETYSRFTICAPETDGSVERVEFDRRTPNARAEFDRVASMPDALLLRAVPRHSTVRLRTLI